MMANVFLIILFGKCFWKGPKVKFSKSGKKITREMIIKSSHSYWVTLFCHLCDRKYLDTCSSSHCAEMLKVRWQTHRYMWTDTYTDICTHKHTHNANTLPKSKANLYFRFLCYVSYTFRIGTKNQLCNRWRENKSFDGKVYVQTINIVIIALKLEVFFSYLLFNIDLCDTVKLTMYYIFFIVWRS